MTNFRMNLIIALAILVVLAFGFSAVGADKPIPEKHKALISPAAQQPTPDPNWELKNQQERQPDPRELYVTSKFAPPGNAPQGKPEMPKSSLFSEDFEVAVPPAGWSTIITIAGYTWKLQTGDYYSGSACADVEYDPSLATQDEWLITPALDFTTATSDLKVKFWWNMSYYWGVSPYNNYDYELWISTDGGATWPTKLWDETAAGAFTSWVWYQATIPLAAYVGQSNVKLAWRYHGSDGAELLLDLVTVDDDPPPTGRCCYGDPLAPSCADNTEAQCTALSGTWDGTTTCADPCPVAGVGDNCSNPIVVTLPAALPYSDLNQFTCGRVDDYDATCLGYYDGGEDIIYQLNVTSAVDLNIMLDPKGTTYTGILVDDACPPDAGTCLATHTNSGGTAHGIAGLHLEPGTYYIMIDTWPTPDCIPDFDLTITTPPPPAEGDNCANPILVKLPEDMGTTGYVNTNYTCGRIDNYNTTCLGSYDGGEDIIYMLDVDAPVNVDITLNPKGTTYTGILIDDACPPDPSTCLATHTSYSSGIHGIYGFHLDPGIYYIMIDTWPSPACIPDFDLNINFAAGPPPNDDWQYAQAIGDVSDLAFATISATFDGPGGCQTAPNIWYCYTATCTGNATASLCGSGFDTKIAVYDGCGDPATLTQLACNDDYCSLQSQATFPVVSGQSYLIEVGAYGTNTGSGLLNTSCTIPPPAPYNDDCGNAVVQAVPATITGNNVGSTGDCTLLDPGSAEAWEAFTITEKMDITIDYCGTSPSFDLVYIVLATACPCDGGELIFATTTDWAGCGGDGNITMTFPALDPGTYYIPVLSYHPSYPTTYCAGPYTIHVNGTPWVPHYCDADGGCDEYISRVTVGSIDNSTGCTGYGDYTGLSTTMPYGSTNPITVENGYPYSSDQCAVWVDWNQDFDFSDANEAIPLTVSTGNGPYTGDIIVPGDALPGATRMRVRINYSAAPPECGTTTYGEVEDYTIEVGGTPTYLTVAPPSIDFGMVPPEGTGYTGLTLGANGPSNLNFSTTIQYGKKASVGGGQCSENLRKSPFNTGAAPALTKDAKALLFEGFESGAVPPAGWSAVVNNPYTWEIGSYNPYEGSYNADCFYDESYSGTQDEWLVSPVLNFAGVKYVVDFWWLGSYYWSVDPYQNCTLSLWISTDGGATWPTKLWDHLQYGEFTTWEWNNTIVNLSAYKNETNVKLAFVYTGYDGAQFSLDAIGINPAPLSWLTVSPPSGVVPGNGTLPLAVSYDAADLTLGSTYTANITITHTGAAKTVTNVPVTMTIGYGGGNTIFLDPSLIYVFYAWSVDPKLLRGYLGGDFEEGYTVDDVNPATVKFNGLTPDSIKMLTSYPDFTGNVMEIYVNMHDCITGYGLPNLWDTTTWDYTISGKFGDDVDFTETGQCTIIGHSAGDANGDRIINIKDATYLINYLYKNGPAPFPMIEVGDANGDGSINIRDVTYLIAFLYKNGPAPHHN
jgi:GEVED domain/Dockerin type I domain